MYSGKKCYGLNCVFPQIHILKSQPPVPQIITIFGQKLFKNVIKLKWAPPPSLGWGPNPVWLVSLPEVEETPGGVHAAEGWSCDEAAQSSLLQDKEGDLRGNYPYQQFNPSWTSACRTGEEYISCCLNYPVCCTLLWQPWQICTLLNERDLFCPVSGCMSDT